MTLIEPLMLTAFVSYVVTPIATYALGFDPSFTWQYAMLFGLLPLVLALPMLIPMIGVLAIFEGDGLVERCGSALVVMFASVATYAAIRHWVHEPQTDLQHVALVFSAPFIGGIVVALAFAIFCIFGGAFGLIAGDKPANNA